MTVARLAVIALPRWSDPADGARVQALRQLHDPQATLVPPHVTLVFPTEADSDAVAAEVAAAAAITPALPLRFTAIAPYADPLSGDTYAFLLPEDGAAVTRLHDRLYAGVLAPRLCPAIPYSPHLTVGRFHVAAEAEALRQTIDMAATLDRLAVLHLTPTGVTEAVAFPLAPLPSVTGT